ncbi:DUF5309 family protein [Nonomuraea angiospora]|uniref:SU10 major capsid protein n=1 Tax=Nonomuraea angiospora TaxID=46172 RepID=UPI0034283562
MAGITPGQGTTFNLPNYTGQLYGISPAETPFLSSIGGLTGGMDAESTEFEWQTYDLRTTSAGNTVVEGAAAPAGQGRVRANVTNVVEIHQSAIEVTYTKMAATQLKSGSNNAERNPIVDELNWQVEQELKAIAVDIEKSFISGAYAKPGTNATARKTRGILAAIATNVLANGGTGRALTKALVDSLCQTVFDAGGLGRADRMVFLVGSKQKLALTKVYAESGYYNQAPMSRDIAGVAVDTIVTDFGTYGVMLDRWMPADQIALVDLDQCAPVWLPIPGKGRLFVEPIAKTGASEKYQLYGEVGLKYGAEQAHGLLKDLL